MVEYTTLKSEEIKYGNNNFLEVARKSIEGNEFISISKGYFLPDGTKRYKGGIGFPDEEGVAEKLVDAVKLMSSPAPAQPKEEVPVAEAPVAEQPKEEAPAVEAPVAEQPKEEAPATPEATA